MTDEDRTVKRIIEAIQERDGLPKGKPIDRRFKNCTNAHQTAKTYAAPDITQTRKFYLELVELADKIGLNKVCKQYEVSKENLYQWRHKLAKEGLYTPPERCIKVKPTLKARSRNFF